MYTVRTVKVEGVRYGHVWNAVSKKYVVSWLPVSSAEGLASLLNEREG